MIKFTPDKTICELDYNQVEDLINEVFQFENEYDLLCDNEMGTSQYTCYLMTTLTGKLDKYDQQDIDKALQSKNPDSLRFRWQAALEYCCQQGAIDPGTYVICISW